MKQMKNVLATTALMVMTMGLLQAQEYKVAKSTGRLEIKEVNHVVVEGYAGNEIIFTSKRENRDADERAKGLRPISGSGLEDNSGIGLSIVDKGGVIEVQQLKKMDGPEVTIKVPKGVVVFYTHTSPYGKEVEFKNMEGDIEVSTVHSGVNLSNVSGPMTVKTVHGNIEGSLSTAIKSPVSIVSVHGHVDVAIPVATKANLKLKTVYGEIFVDPDFKIEIERTDNMVKYSDNVAGKINGGGIELTLSSTHDNIYMRKK